MLTETNSPVPMLSAPAVRAAMPAITMAVLSDVAPATPMTTPAVDTMPSLAPSTAARSQFSRDADVVAHLVVEVLRLLVGADLHAHPTILAKSGAVFQRR